MTDDETGRAISGNIGVLAVAVVAVTAAVIGGMAMAGNGTPAADDVLDDAQNRYESAGNVAGTAVVTVENENGTVERSAEVTFTATDDNESRVAVTASNRTVVVGSNGSVGWVHLEEAGLTQAVELPDDPDEWSGMNASVLAGDENLTASIADAVEELRERYGDLVPAEDEWNASQKSHLQNLSESDVDWNLSDGDHDWNLSESDIDWNLSGGDHDWNLSESDIDWNLSGGDHDWNLSDGGYDWNLSESDIDWNLSDRDYDWNLSGGGYDWNLSDGGYDWNLSDGGYDWNLSDGSYDWNLSDVDWNLSESDIDWNLSDGDYDWNLSDGDYDWNLSGAWNQSAFGTPVWNWTQENVSTERVGTETVMGTEAHLIEIQPAGESEGTLRVWIGTDDSRVLKTELTRGDWTVTVRYTSLQFDVSLADSTFQPPGTGPTENTAVDSREELQATTEFNVPAAPEEYTFAEGSTVVYGDATVAIGSYTGPENVTIATTTADQLPVGAVSDVEANASTVELAGQPATVADSDRGVVVSWEQDGVRNAVIVEASQETAVSVAESIINESG